MTAGLNGLTHLTFQVPNSLPNRGNIEIEIYGMEGIPAEDLRNHELNRGVVGE